MSFHVPENQTVSWSIYWPSLQREAALRDYTHDEVAAQIATAMQCFDRGEPIWMAALTVKLMVDTQSARDSIARSKTPLQLARRVVRL